MPFINVRFATNVQELKANLAQGVDQIEATRAAADKMVKSLGGDNIVAAAHKYAAAVQEIGGAAKLTEANQARVNAVMVKAVDVLNAAGKGGSDLAKHFQSLADATANVHKETSGWLPLLGDLGHSFVARVAEGVLLRDAIHKVLDAVHGLTIGLAEELGTLALQGAAVADVEDAYKRLTSQAGRLGSTLLNELRAGTHNTITDFDLMKRVNQDLAAGLNLTDKQFGTLAKGAFALAQATGTDVKTALDTMNDAMLTGRTRSLALLTGKINLTKAEEDFATSLHTTVDHLSEEGKLEGARLAILKAVGDATEKLGEQTDGLDEKVAQAQVSWTNLKEELGKTIATSKVLETGLDGVKQILLETFGGNQESLIKAIASAIESAEIKIVELAVSAGEAGGFIVKEFYAVKKLFGDVAQVIDGVRLSILLARQASALGILPGTADVTKWKALDDTIGKLEVSMKQRGDALQADDAAQKAVDASTAALTKRLSDLKDKMEAARKGAADFVGPLQNTADAQAAAAASAANHARFLKQSSEEISKAKAAAEKLTAAWLELNSLGEDYRATLAALSPEQIKTIAYFLKEGASVDLLAAAFPNLTKAQIKAVEESGKALDAIIKRMDEFKAGGVSAAEAIGKSLSGMPGVLRGIGQSLGDINLDAKKIPVTGVLIGTTFEDSATKIRAAMTASARSFLPLNQVQKDTIDLMYRLGFSAEDIAKTMNLSLDSVKTHVFSLGESIKGTLKGVPDLLIQALLGGGGISGAFKALGVQLGKDFADGLVSTIKKAVLPGASKPGVAGITASSLGAAGGLGALAGIGAAAAGASTGQALGTVASTGAAVGLQVGSIVAAAKGLAAGISSAVSIGAATLGIGAAVVGIIALYKAKHKAEWQRLGSDIGRDFGVALSEETLKAWEQQSKLLGRQATELLHLDELIAAHGGIKDFGFDKAAQGAHDLFSMIQTGKLTIGQVRGELDKLWPELSKGGTDAYGRINDKLKELIRLNQIYNTDSKEIAAFLKQQGSNVIFGFNATVETLGTSTRSGVEFVKIGKDVKDAQAAVDQLVATGKTGTSEWRDAVAKLNLELAKQKQAAEESKETLADLGMQAVGAYAAAVAAGATPAEALAQIAPSLLIISQGYKNLGLDVEDVGLKALLMQNTILNGTSKLGAGLAGLNTEFVALDNLGLLTPEIFASMERTGSKMFDRLSAEAEAAGGTSKDALIPMQQWLHEAEDAAKKYSYKLDDATQAMIDLSKEQGIWKAEDPTDTITGGMKELVKVVKELINTLRGIPNEIPDPTRNWDRTGIGGIGGGGSGGSGGGGSGGGDRNKAATGGIVRPWGIQQFAEGGIVPALALLPTPRQAVQRFAQGGLVTALGIPRFDMGGRVTAWPGTSRTPAGTDTVPALLTPGEVVLNAPQQKGLREIFARLAGTISTFVNAVAPIRQTGVAGEAGAPGVIDTLVSRIFGVPITTTAGAIDGVGFAAGGTVPSLNSQHFEHGRNVLPFIPRGRDIVPAMLTPGELVLNEGQQAVMADMLHASASMASDLLHVGGSSSFNERAPISGDLHVSLVLDGKVVTKTVIKNFRYNKDSAYTEARAALGMTS